MRMTTDDERPAYDYGDKCMLNGRARRARDFAQQIIATARPFLPAHASKLCVLDVGCGYGHTAVELAKECAHVVAIEPNQVLFKYAEQLKTITGLGNIDFRHQPIELLDDDSCYDLVVLDNVLEHIANQPIALQRICRCLRPQGVMFIVVPNKLWPIEVHYGLPFLSYLPLWLANWYLRISGRGRDYTDASYAPTFWKVNRLLRECRTLTHQYVLPADVSLASLGDNLHYRIGVAALRRFPWLWPLAKVFLVIAVKA